MRNEIIRTFPEPPAKIYIEVFGGAGWVLFGKDKTPGQIEIFNDVNSDLIKLFRCVKYHESELCRELAITIQSREMFNDFFQQLKSPGLTELQRAAMYFYLIKNSFGCNVRNFATRKKDISSALEKLPKIQERLRGVVIENRDFEKILSQYDSERSLFFLDPPYYEAEDCYKDKFTLEDHYRLKNALDKVEGKFILTYNDDLFIRQLYCDYYIRGISRNSTLAAKSNNAEQYFELIITNFSQD